MHLLGQFSILNFGIASVSTPSFPLFPMPVLGYFKFPGTMGFCSREERLDSTQQHGQVGIYSQGTEVGVSDGKLRGNIRVRELGELLAKLT